MFGLGKSKPKGEQAEFKIEGMHCTSCAMNIDGELEELDGVSESNTNFAKSTSEVIFDPGKTSVSQIEKTITKLGYSIKK